MLKNTLYNAKGDAIKASQSAADEFSIYKSEMEQSIKAVLKKVAEEKSTRQCVDFSSYPAEKLKSEISKALENALGVQESTINLAIPPEHIKGDFALEVFDLAKKLGEKPSVVARRISDELGAGSGLIANASLVGPFVNISTRRDVLYREILSNIMALGEHYGESDVNASKTVVIDYSAPNIAKPIGVGHLRSTVIGQALANLYHETGYSVIRDNHLGDWGTQFGSLIFAYREWGDEKNIETDPIRKLKDLYVRFHKVSEEDVAIKDKARELFALLDRKDHRMVVLWKRFRDLSLRDFQHIYKRLRIEFDTYVGESFFTDQADILVEECMVKGLCRKDTESEAIVVDEMAGLPSFLLRKQDGSSLYISRDLATIQFRVSVFKPDTILYVVGNEQDLNFKQLFELAKKGGYLPDSTDAKHIGFGMVLRDGKKMSTRRGTLIELEELLTQSVDKSREILLQKNPDVSSEQLNETSEIVGIGAILYNNLRQSRFKNISFDWDRMLDLEGGSAVYLQYSYVRINSILRKIVEHYGEFDSNMLKKKDIAFENGTEFNLAIKLMMFPEVILKAQTSDSPHHICVYLEELALLFNSFYNETSILRTEDKRLRYSRIALCEGVALVIRRGLNLLNIRVPDRM